MSNQQAYQTYGTGLRGGNASGRDGQETSEDGSKRTSWITTSGCEGINRGEREREDREEGEERGLSGHLDGEE